MKIQWEIESQDVQRLKKFMKANEGDFVIDRRNRNIEKRKEPIDENSLIKAMIMALITSQQRSGKGTKVSEFLNLKPFPINVKSILNSDKIEEDTKLILRKNGLTRFLNRNSNFFTYNINTIRSDDWRLLGMINELKLKDSKEAERKLADHIDEEFKGLGPKQSRNLLQALGATKYEIPIDSRITRWLNKFGFPVRLTASALSDKNYYHFVNDGIHELSKAVGIYPCEFDAYVFSSYEKDGWEGYKTTY